MNIFCVSIFPNWVVLITFVIFWVSFFLIAYPFFVYPICLKLISLFFKRTPLKDNIIPTVTLVIAAYNEEKIIKKKIYNTIKIDYPKEKLKIIVASDGSTDKTDEIVKSFSDVGIVLFRVEGRVGKTETLNRAVEETVNSNIVIFSDANSMYKPDAIRKLVRNFSDTKVGCVCGELLYVSPFGDGNGEGQYWKYERLLKRLESSIDSILGANGSIYAFRRDLYEKVPSNLLDDFIRPIYIYKKGYRIIYEPEAVCYEMSCVTQVQEYKRKVRIINRGLFSVYAIKYVLNPLKYPLFSFQMWSHKICRWLAPLFIMSLVFCSLLLLEIFIYKIFLILIVLFLIFGLIGLYFESRGRKIGILTIPCYFLINNIAALIGIIEFLKGKRKVVWEPIR